MILNNTRFLKKVLYSEFTNWSVSSFKSEKQIYSTTFQKQRIEELLYRNRKLINIEDNKKYKQVTVKLYGNGVTQRGADLIWGKEIATKKQYIVSSGQFIMSKIDARHGAFGIVPPSLDGAVTTQDFLSYEINTKKILPSYFVLLTSSKPFYELCQKSSSGTTGRQRINEKVFLKFEIPVPPTLKQESIIKQYDNTLAEIKTNEKIIASIETEIDLLIHNTLGIATKKKIDIRNFYTLAYKEINRWDVWNQVSEFHQSKHPLYSLKNLIKLTSGKFLRKADQKPGQYQVFGGNGLMGNHDQYLYTGKSIIIGRVGENCGNVHIVEGKYWVTDNAFKVEKISDLVDIDYLEIALNALNLNNFKVQSAQPSISQTSILNLSIPLSPLNEQIVFADKVNRLKYEVKGLKNQNEELKKTSTSNFEKEIFKDYDEYLSN